MVKRLFSVIALLTLTLSVAAQTTFAATWNDGSVCVMVCGRPTSVEFTDSDIFEIFYENNETGSEGSFQVTAGQATFDYSVPVGSYTVTDIVYEGDNELMEEIGYGVSPSFISEKDGGSLCYVAIGKMAVESLLETHVSAVVKDENHDEEGDWIPEAYDALYGNYDDESDEVEESAESDSNTTEYVSADEDVSDPSEIIIEYYGTEDEYSLLEESKGPLRNIGINLLIISCVAAVFFAAAGIYKKRHDKRKGRR